MILFECAYKYYKYYCWMKTGEVEMRDTQSNFYFVLFLPSFHDFGAPWDITPFLYS